MRLLEGRRVAAADDDVEAIAERPVRLRQLEVEPADEPLACLLVADGVEDRVELEQRIAGKYICVTSRSVNARPKSEKWMWFGRHAFGWFGQG